MRIRKLHSIAGLVSLLFVLLFTFISNRQQTNVIPNASNIPVVSMTPTLIGTPENVVVTRVVDGDTIELNTGKKVRYIGINTPETVDPRRPVQCFGMEAKEKNKELVEGKAVRLEKDVSETDKYGRLLRYVWIKNDRGEEEMINKILVTDGYAYSSSYPPDIKYQQIFLQAEHEARNNGKGLWNACPLKSQ